MEQHKFDIDQIDAYLQNSMDQDERHLFDKYMQDNPKFAEEVTLQRDFLTALEAHYNEELKQKLKAAASADEKPTFQVIKMKPKLVLSLAASFAILFVASYFLVFKTQNSEDLYMAYYEPYMNTIGATRGNGDSSVNKAYQLYGEKNFDGAIAAFREALKTTPEDEPLNFYLAISLLSANKPGEATALLEKLNRRQDGIYLEPVQWYLGLAYLKQEQIDKAKNQLQLIVDEKGSYADKASTILDEL